MKRQVVGGLATLVVVSALTVAWLYYWPTAPWRTSVTIINRSGVELADVDLFCRQGDTEIRRELGILEANDTIFIRVQPEILSGTIGFKIDMKQLWQRIDVDFWSGEQVRLVIGEDGTLEVVNGW